MKRIYCDVHGTLVNGPHSTRDLLQAMHDTGLPVLFVSGDPFSASELLGPNLMVHDKLSVIGDIEGAIWIDDDKSMLRAVSRLGATAVHVDDALVELERYSRVRVSKNPVRRSGGRRWRHVR